MGSVGWGRHGAPGPDSGCRGQGGRCAERQAVMEESLISRVTLLKVSYVICQASEKCKIWCLSFKRQETGANNNLKI